MGLGICGWATSRGVGAWGSTVPGMTEALAAPHRRAVGDLGDLRLGLRAVGGSHVRGLTGSAGSADVLVRGATVGSQFGAAATFAVLQIAAAAAVVRGLRRRRRREWVVLLSTARTQRAHIRLGAAARIESVAGQRV